MISLVSGITTSGKFMRMRATSFRYCDLVRGDEESRFGIELCMNQFWTILIRTHDLGIAL